MKGDPMPQKRIAGCVLLLGCGAILPAIAQTPGSRPSEAPAKVAVVQYQPAVAATNEFQRDFAEVQKKFEPKRAQLKNLGDEIDQLTKRLESDGPKLSEAEQASRARTIDNKKKQAQRLADDDQNEYEQAVQEVFNRVAAKVGDVLTKYAGDHGYTLVVDRSERQDSTPAVLWADPSIDITQPIVEAYNAKSGVPAQGGAGAPPAPKPTPPR